MTVAIKSTAKLLLSAISLALVAVVVALSLGVREVLAEEEAEEESDVTVTDTESAQPYVPTQYQFITQEGNNTTLLVRRAIQLFCLAKPDLMMSEAQIIYTENNVVREIDGQDLIYPGQSIVVPSDLVSSYTASSQVLTAGQIADWQYYADRADFDLSYIQADNVALTEGGEIVAAVNGTPVVGTSETEDTEDAEEESEFLGMGWYWWLAIIAVVGIGVVVSRDQKRSLNK